MALNKEVFRVRATSAVFFVIVMLAGLLWNHWSFLVLFTVIHFGCWWEYMNLMEKINQGTINRYARFGFMLSGFAIMLSFCGKAYVIQGYGLKENLCLPLSVAGFILLVIGILQKGNFNLKAFGMATLGWAYISLSWGMMISLRQMGCDFEAEFTPHILRLFCLENGKYVVIVLVASIWINDTMAYMVGSFIGKTPFSKISPKKTWEGTAGGPILAIVGMAIAAHYGFELSCAASIVVPAIAAVMGTLGDLLESKIKRVAGVKDSGTMMPGHGGFMDRFDSLLLATPFVWLYMVVLDNSVEHDYSSHQFSRLLIKYVLIFYFVRKDVFAPAQTYDYVPTAFVCSNSLYICTTKTKTIMKTKYTLLALAMFLGILSATAQTTFGIHGSFIYSSLSSKSDGSSSDSYEGFLKSRPSFRAGVITFIPINKNISVIPQLNYVAGGAKLKGNSADAIFEFSVDGTIKMNFVELPLNLAYTKTFKTETGSSLAAPSIAMGIGGRIKATSSFVGMPTDEIDSKVKFDGDKNATDDYTHFKRMDFGINFLAGYQLANNFFVQANFNQGLSNIDVEEGSSTKTNYFGIGVGYTFGGTSKK